MPRRIALRLFLVSLAFVLVAATTPPEARAASQGSSRTPPAATVRLHGEDYVEARVFFGRYGLKPVVLESGKRVRFESPWTKIELEVERREVAFNGMRVFLGAPPVLHRRTLHLSRIDADRLFAPILRPATYGASAPPLRVIAVDAGHGGRDTGTQNPRFKLAEKDLTLDVARRLQVLLQREGYKVVMTRTDDRFIELDERAAIANRANADLFVSVHFNAVANAPTVRGTETYVMTPRHHASTQPERDKSMVPTSYPGNRFDVWNALLGYHLHRKLMDKLGTFDRGLKRARFKVLTLVECPGVLIESAYLSNDGEADKIRSTAYRDELAEAIAEGIRAYSIQLEGARKD
jgi:N-acetylmuramoyl-L-alanine amidase